MAVFAAIAFAAFLFENDHLVAFHEGLEHLAYNFCAFYCRSTYFYCAVGVSEEYTVELNLVACFVGFAEIVDIQESALFGFELLSLDFYDYVHRWI